MTGKDVKKYTDGDIAVTSFYCFVNVEEPELVQPKMLYIAKRKMIKGTILLAKEGYNGTICGNEADVMMLLDELAKQTGAVDVSIKTNYCKEMPFSKIKVKLKKEIVALKAGDIDVNALKGEYIESKDWDEFISRDDVILIDTRNDYEIHAGTFKHAVNPNTETFRELPEWEEKHRQELKGKKIAMCCTGGIRCEKSTAFMKKMGYEEVYHLKGGILQYLEDTGNKSGFWQGECFVFDDRGAVTDDLAPAEGYWVERDKGAKQSVKDMM